MAAVERLPVLHYSADDILFLLGSLGPLWYLLKWSSVLLMYSLEGESSVAKFITAYEESQ